MLRLSEAELKGPVPVYGCQSGRIMAAYSPLCVDVCATFRRPPNPDWTATGGWLDYVGGRWLLGSQQGAIMIKRKGHCALCSIY